ncbi:Mus7/MMS22 family-domain-containing protein [Hypoxylon sp. FL1284]|nr:Mus7/MMS22 family-domain-containing protein [Hypoxylon sp. FL1284]
MAKWKELGEVPDSEDESIFNSSQESDALPFQGSDARTPETLVQGQAEDAAEDATESPTPRNHDVWDIPPSSQDHEEGNHVYPDSTHRPLSPKPPSRPTHEPQSAPAHDSSPLSSLPPELSNDPESLVQAAGIGGRGLDEPAPSSSRRYVSAAFELRVASDEEDSILYQQTTGRNGARSLRPRKPIQEHPYLLEGAQYSKALRSRGVRPLRVNAEEAARKKAEEDSQEQEYEEDSQSTFREQTQEDTGESQGIQFPSLLDIDDGQTAPTGVPSPSPRPTELQVEPLLNSSQSGSHSDEELPDLADIEKWKKLAKKPAATSKRQASPKVSEKRKLPRLRQPARFTRETSPTPPANIFDIPPSPPNTSPNLLNATPVNPPGRSKLVSTLTPKLSSSTSSRVQSPVPANRSTSLVDLTMAEDEDEDEEGDQTGDELGMGSGGDSESDTEHRRAAMRRRMRGVLPASWLRLDQQSSRQRNKKSLPQRIPDQSPERTQRRGVAQRRQVSPKPGVDNALFLGDSDDDDMTLRINEISEPSQNNDNIPIFEDDAGSVIEEDYIDDMFQGSKRPGADIGRQGRPRKRRRNQQSTFKDPAGPPKRQQRITGLLSRTKDAAVGSAARSHASRNGSVAKRRTKELNKRPVRSPAPPQLSILDVVEQDAPPFIRIAARTARKRSDKGRSSPSKKHISLGTRRDNIDAMGVLTDWKRGRIQPRTPTNTAKKHQSNLPKPLDPLSHNSVTQPPKTTSKVRSRRVVPSSRFSQPRRMIKQASIENFVSVETDTQFTDTYTQPSPPVPVPRHTQISRSKSYNTISRPAQLEAAEENISRQAFDKRKRALDALYRRSRKALPNVALEEFVGHSASKENRHALAEGLSSVDSPESREPEAPRTRLKFRKRLRPQQLDISAPQFAHANDPLPREASPVSPVEVTNVSEPRGKLLGLGPFGTHYTQHFEVFPLDQGVFFHESTLLGSGRLIKVLDEKSRDSLHHSRGGCSFTLGEKSLRWNQWDAQTSSELGIVFDWIVDCFHSEPADSNNSVPVPATDFVLDYLQDHISFPDQESEKHFAGRALEILQSLSQRLEALPALAHDRARAFIDVLSRCLIVTFQILRICQNLNHLSEAFQVEETLKSIARWTTRKLLETDLVDIRNLYYDLQGRSVRERGIRNEHYSLVCWVILIRVLEEARIPRCGFWDVVSSVMLSADPNSIDDANVFERIWSNLFTLLPLGEFDNFGVVVSGSRHATPLEGWSLPQRLLKRVFQLYEGNSRQAPSFNDYCRGLVSRCHYLVEQWGWRKSNGIIGTIFDFFAARGLSHLRNEEVYKSPDFLEHLAGSPSLAVVAEDRCFHIFLKLLALSIKRLEDNGLTKDVRNLVARVLPNHNRQYDKENDIHESDLAALRNHHDLLCTLFWAAPPSLRPSVQTIEKLVIPGSSHKEACLISLRAWTQLSQFVMSLGGDNSTYKPFADWQKNVFQQVMEQYLSAESDIQQQLAKMSKDASMNISRDMMNAVVKLNRKGAMDVLHFSMKGFLSVLRQAPTLNAVSFALNHYQLDQVFTRFPFSSVDFDWSSLRAALDILDYYIARIEEFLSQGQVAADHSWHGEDAIMLLERKMAVPLFSMAHTLARMGSGVAGIGPTSDREICVEQAISLAGRQGARLIRAQLSGVSRFFTTGKYSIFQDLSKSASSPSRKYHSLFASVLIEHGVSESKDLGETMLNILLLELVKPFSFLSYENRLALAIKRHGDVYLKDAVIEVGNNPDYYSNRDLFAHVVATMRRTLRRAEASQKGQLQSQFSKAIRSTMDQMKLDLKSMTLDSPEHGKYIEFVRSLITVIRSQDLCPVDSYFYQISREYSPSAQDPRLQIAGILSWGLKLEEGDTKAVPGLFYFLFPSFKLALANGKLADEEAILQQGMANPHVLSFVLGRMFPAMIKTAVQTTAGSVLLSTHINAFETHLTMSCVHRAMGEEDMEGLLVLLQYTLTSIRELQVLDVFELHHENVYTLVQIIRLFNLLSPFFAVFLINDPTAQLAKEVTGAIDMFTSFTRTAATYLSTLVKESRGAMTLDPVRLLEGIRAHRAGSTRERNEHVNGFANYMVRDIKNNWILDGSTINIQGPSRGLGHSATQSGQGSAVPKWGVRKLVRTLQGQLQEWNYKNDTAVTTSRRVELPLDEYLF